jgi:hypothetical protein
MDENIIDVGWHMGRTNRPKKVVFCVPVYPKEPYKQTVAAFEAEKPFLETAGWGSEVIYQTGLPYISASRAMLLHEALKRDATVIVFVDQDISWTPGSAVKLIETEGGVVGGTYRYKNDEERYMGGLREVEEGGGVARTREDGCLEAYVVPAGFLKVTREAVNLMIAKHPELCCGEACSPHFDMFAHGIMEGEWRGEDTAVCLRWWQMGQKVWVVPDLDITHHSADRDYPGNLARYLERIAGYSTADLGKYTVEEQPVNASSIVEPQIDKAELARRVKALKHQGNHGKK